MADLGDPNFYLAIGVIAALVVGMGLLGWTLYKGYKEQKRRLELEAELKDILGREELQLLRHRDFEAFVERVNQLRKEKGQSSIEREFLAKIQYNLMYSLDESDF